MKRSDMIERLRSSFLHHMNSQDCCSDDDVMYGHVLGDLEEAGMLPPEWLEHFPDGHDDMFDVPVKHSYYRRTWETE